jgi:hypothetical protein
MKAAQDEMKSDINVQAAARQDMANDEANTSHEQLYEDRISRNFKDFKENPEATEAVVERQKLRKCLAVRRHQWAKKRTQDSVGSRQNSTARK